MAFDQRSKHRHQQIGAKYRTRLFHMEIRNGPPVMLKVALQSVIIKACLFIAGMVAGEPIELSGQKGRCTREDG